MSVCRKKATNERYEGCVASKRGIRDRFRGAQPAREAEGRGSGQQSQQHREHRGVQGSTGSNAGSREGFRAAQPATPQAPMGSVQHMQHHVIPRGLQRNNSMTVRSC